MGRKKALAGSTREDGVLSSLDGVLSSLTRQNGVFSSLDGVFSSLDGVCSSLDGVCSSVADTFKRWVCGELTVTTQTPASGVLERYG